VSGRATHSPASRSSRIDDVDQPIRSHESTGPQVAARVTSDRFTSTGPLSTPGFCACEMIPMYSLDHVWRTREWAVERLWNSGCAFGDRADYLHPRMLSWSNEVAAGGGGQRTSQRVGDLLCREIQDLGKQGGRCIIACTGLDIHL